MTINIHIYYVIICSIGSLAKELNEDGVENVTLSSSVFTGTQNGVRIKSWARPSTGFVKNVFFQDLIMKNVQNPIIIDQKYCPDHQDCLTEVHIYQYLSYLDQTDRINLSNRVI